VVIRLPFLRASALRSVALITWFDSQPTG
jgi:hypothetical protein